MVIKKLIFRHRFDAKTRPGLTHKSKSSCQKVSELSLLSKSSGTDIDAKTRPASQTRAKAIVKKPQTSAYQAKLPPADSHTLTDMPCYLECTHASASGFSMQQNHLHIKLNKLQAGLQTHVDQPLLPAWWSCIRRCLAQTHTHLQTAQCSSDRADKL